MKRSAKENLSGPPKKAKKVPAILNKNFEFLEFSVCVAATTESEVKQPSTTDKRNVRRNLAVDEINVLDFHQPIKMESFARLLLTIGPCVKNVRIVSGNAAILPYVEKHCTNVNRMELLEGEGSLRLANFRNLTEMKVPNVRIATHAFEKCLTNSPNLECLEFDHFWYGTDFMELSEMLPTLKSLGLVRMAMAENDPKNAKNKRKQKFLPCDYSLIPKLLQSRTLTKFSFDTERNCNELLKLLPYHKPNIEELAFRMYVNSETFELVGQLKNLKVLSITNAKDTRKIGKVRSIWPSKLIHLTLKRIVISDNDLLLIMMELKFLEELHIGTTNSRHQHPWLHDMQIIPRIEEILKVRRRTFKIFFSCADDRNPYKYKSSSLEIINQCVVNLEVEPLHIIISN